MKVYNNSLLSFKGNFWYATDDHGRLKEVAEGLSNLEHRTKNSDTQNYYLNGGDIVSSICSETDMADTYKVFADRNPDVQMIFGLGNAETDLDSASKEEGLPKLTSIVRSMTECPNINFISVFANELGLQKYVKPYIIVNDRVQEGNNTIDKKVLITSVFTDSGSKDFPLEVQKQALKRVLEPALQKENPDEIVLISHNFNKNTEELADYAKNELQISNLLVLGAHSHRMSNTNAGGTRVLYPPVMGTSIVKIAHKKNGFDFPIMPVDPDNPYNYFYNATGSGSDILRTVDDSRIIPTYLEPFLRDKSVTEHVVKLSQPLTYRDNMTMDVSAPCEIGSLICDEMLKSSKADLAVLLTMTLRHGLPPLGSNVIMYDLRKTVIDDHKVYFIHDVTSEELLDLFEESLTEQSSGKNNRNFLEFSSNVKIERYPDIKDSATPKIKQILINDKPILNPSPKGVKAEPKNKDKTYKIATCEYLVNNAESRGFPSIAGHTISLFDENYTLTGAFAQGLRNLESCKKKPPLPQLVDFIEPAL